MNDVQNQWVITDTNETLCQEMASACGVSTIIARILLNRGISDVLDAKAFLSSDYAQLGNPQMLKDMDKAVKRIVYAIENKEKIVVYGDYDADGVTSTTLLLDALMFVGYEAGYYIPDRLEEGYGLNCEALDNLGTEGVKLIITVDCGISSVQEVKHAKTREIDIIITDHHEPSELIPNAVAVINPKQQDCPYPFKGLAGVGVAFKLAQALFKYFEVPPDAEQKLLDLVCLGTIADLAPLLGENRILVRHGLPRLTQSHRSGIRNLMDVSGLTGRIIGAGQVGFSLAPRINATGRIGDAAIAVKLLRTDDALRAREMAVYLDSENQTRQEIEAQVLSEALEMLLDFEPERDRVIVLAKQGWHPGVLGIAASRLVERYYRPVILIALEGNDGKGSGRSISGFNLFQNLQKCSAILTKFGGHKQAAGLSIVAENIPLLKKTFNDFAWQLSAEDFIPKLRADAFIELAEVDAALVQAFKCLEPFGIGNPNPVLISKELTILEFRAVGKEKNHLKLKIRGKSSALDGIGFNLATKKRWLKQGEIADVAFTPDFNEFNGRISVQLLVKDIRISHEKSRSDEYERLSPNTLELVDRDVLARIYTEILSISRTEVNLGDYPQDVIATRLGIRVDLVQTGLEIFEELGVVERKLEKERRIFLFRAPSGKLDLQASEKYRQGRALAEGRAILPYQNA